MPLVAGTPIGPYEILAPLGSGGMGEVYKARDSRLNRLVALKVLPRDRMANAERRQRFVQEAQLASSLQHPHIVVIYEIGAAEGIEFISMELVRGRTLEAVIPRAGLRLQEALKIAVQIADALAAAHAAGVVHRDLKPGNLMVTDEGQVKVLDFGLAKLMETAPPGELEETRTQAEAVKTEDGTILGSAPYMSPEQVDGKNVDARSDIFSFGAILYEMLTGKRAFSGDSRMSTLAAVLQSAPKQLSSVSPETVPREVERLVMRCLRKDVNSRAQHMADLRIALAELLEDSQSGSLEWAPVLPRRKVRAGWMAAAAAAAAVVLGGAWWLRSGESSMAFEPVRLTTLPGSEICPSFSPDGTQVAFQWNGEEGRQNDIYVKLIGGGPPLRLTSDAGVHLCPKWSLDGKSIAYYATHEDGRRGVFLIPALGGPERLVMDTMGTGFERIAGLPAWSSDGKWLAISPPPQAVMAQGVILISPEGGQRIDLEKLDPAYARSREAEFSPDSRRLVFTTSPGGSNTATIWAVELSADKKPRGKPVQVFTSKLGAQYPIWTADGREILFQEGTPNSSGAIMRVSTDGGGKARKIPGLGYTSGPMVLSRNGRLAYSQGGFNNEIWRYDLKGGEAPRRIAPSTAFDSSAEYSPDGRRIVFSSNRAGARELWVCDADGSNPIQITHFGGPPAGTPRWSPNGREIAFDGRPDGNADIFVVNAEGGNLRRLTDSPAEDARPAWSPDGKTVYFSSNRGGQLEIWRMPAEGGQPIQITKHGGFVALPPHDDQWLFYAVSQVPNTAEIWKIRPDGTGDSSIETKPTYSLAMTVTQTALYGNGRGVVYSMSLSDGKISQLLKIGFGPGMGLSLTPDERYILLTKPDQAGSDLVLVEGFR